MAGSSRAHPLEVGQPIIFLTEAIDDAREARIWYAEHSPQLAEDFIEELDRALALVSRTPESWPPFEAGTRRILLRRFPYSIIYNLSEDAIAVIAIAHAKRRPGYWRDR